MSGGELACAHASSAPGPEVYGQIKWELSGNANGCVMAEAARALLADSSHLLDVPPGPRPVAASRGRRSLPLDRPLRGFVSPASPALILINFNLIYSPGRPFVPA
ncbi:hypothetical protein EVAR_14662_1 [Eumeta japonica]|uniref:Uncharacterized protein n=1 Tax=Eumeta variegata TaxID=151549 RepID=A0A4C1U218_EUMVA|nr:hypothetical protein EVAR_14662_1 [Eumeta japonica]